MRDNYKLGDARAICDRCGQEFRRSQLRKEWTGLRVCDGPSTSNCYEVRHPQEFVRGKADKQTPAWTRPEPEPEFVQPRVWNDATKAWENA